MNNKHSARAAQWWKSLDPSTRQRLLDLNLEEGDRLPEEFVPNLQDHGIRPVKWVGPIGHIVPGEILDLLNEKRTE